MVLMVSRAGGEMFGLAAIYQTVLIVLDGYSSSKGSSLLASR